MCLLHDPWAMCVACRHGQQDATGLSVFHQLKGFAISEQRAQSTSHHRLDDTADVPLYTFDVPPACIRQEVSSSIILPVYLKQHR